MVEYRTNKAINTETEYNDTDTSNSFPWTLELSIQM